jgi:hypothetical protein
LNIYSIFSKIDSFHEILNNCNFDILFSNETKLNNQIPDSFLSHKNYACYRRDRNLGNGIENRSGGIAIYIKKEFIHSVKISDIFEAMHLTFILKNETLNFISSYKSPSSKDLDFLTYLDTILLSINLDDPLFIIGDLSMDLLSAKGQPLLDFMEEQKIKNFVNEPTRVSSKFFKSSGVNQHSNTLIDVILHNKDLISCTEVVGCPYSDHNFVLAAIKIVSNKPKSQTIWSRSYSEKNLKQIEEILSKSDFSAIDNLDSVNDKWNYFKNLLLRILDSTSEKNHLTR